MSFSELLKQCRKKQGISQAELASKLGVTQQAVGKWESGKSSPDPSTVARIAELLNTTADYLLGLYRPVSNVSAPEERFFGSYSESLPGSRSRSSLKPSPIIVTDSELTIHSRSPLAAIAEPKQIGRIACGSRKARSPLPAISATTA